MAEHVRWGIIGATARVAQGSVIPAICESDTAKLTAVASRSLSSAQEVAGECGQDNVAAYGDYDSLLADPNVDVVYIPLPNNLHVGWAVEAMNNGKHVLCEKPFALSANQAREMAQAADDNGVVLSEAFMYWYHPLQQDVLRRVRAGQLGTVQAVTSHFAFVQNETRDYRFSVSMGGGALLDVGCYGVHIARQAFGREPLSASASWTRDPETDVDITVSATLDFGQGGTSYLECAFSDTYRAEYQITGTLGTLRVARFFHDERDANGEYVFVPVNGAPQPLDVPMGNMFAAEVDAFSRRVRGEDVPFLPPSDAVGNMAVLDAIALSARTNAAAAVG